MAKEQKNRSIAKTVKLIERFQSKDFEIIVEYKCEDTNWQTKWEMRQKNGSPTPCSGYLQSTDNLTEAQSRFLDFLEDNFILVPYDND